MNEIDRPAGRRRNNVVLVSAKDENLGRQSHRVLPWYLRACVGFVREIQERLERRGSCKWQL
jgi:hypothetical protein